MEPKYLKDIKPEGVLRLLEKGVKGFSSNGDIVEIETPNGNSYSVNQGIWQKATEYRGQENTLGLMTGAVPILGIKSPSSYALGQKDKRYSN